MPNAVALKVLVVDDQNSVRQMTRMTLEEIGIRHIHEAENGVQAMETASLQPIATFSVTNFLKIHFRATSRCSSPAPGPGSTTRPGRSGRCSGRPRSRS